MQTPKASNKTRTTILEHVVKVKASKCGGVFECGSMGVWECFLFKFVILILLVIVIGLDRLAGQTQAAD